MGAVVFTMTVSVDGYTADADGGITWAPPAPGLFRVHLERVSRLGAHLCGRRLHEVMLPWETDPGMRRDADTAAFADAWAAVPKVVFSRSLREVRGHARLATRPLHEELAAVRADTDRDVEVGGNDLAAQALRAGLVDELLLFRAPVVLGGGTPYLPPLDRPLALRLLGSREHDGGVVEERYAVVRG